MAPAPIGVAMRHIAKASDAASYVDIVLKDAPRVLLAGWHRDVYNIWQDSLNHQNPVLYTGTESPAKKRRNVEEFTNGDSRVMMISLRSGAGLDGLQEYCSDVVFGELDWSPKVHKQVVGRLRRPGQTKQVTAHYLHTNGGSDPIIMDILGIKSDQSRGITDPTLGMEARQKDDSRMRKLAMPKFICKINEGQLALPLVRMEDSQKSAKGVHLQDLADYLDARRAEGLRELKQIYG